MGVTITYGGTVPSLNDPSTFNDRAIALFNWIVGTGSGQLLGELADMDAADFFSVQSNAADATAGRLLKVGASATVLTASPVLRTSLGGSANAITLTTGASLSSVPTGMLVRFRATAANTGATTINLDGTGAVAARTITGVALPAGYIRTDVDTEAYFDGTNWIVRREMERGNNANGEYTRHEAGGQICWNASFGNFVPNSALGPLFLAASESWTFPAEFSAAPALSGAGHSSNRWPTFGSVTATSAGVQALATTSQIAAAPVRVIATGRWY